MWSKLNLNNEHTVSQAPWSSVAGTLISDSNGTPGSVPARQQQVCCLRCLHLFGSSCRIFEDFVPPHGHLVSTWSTGGYEWPPIWLRNSLWYSYLGGPENQKEQKAICCALATPAESSYWCLRMAVCLLLSIDDIVPGPHLCLPHLICAASMLGRDKQQRDAPVFPSLSALISKDWVLASRCYNRNHLCSTWDRYLTAGLFSCTVKPLFLHKKQKWLASQQKLKGGAFAVVQMWG